MIQLLFFRISCQKNVVVHKMQKRIAVHVLYSSGDENLGRYSVDQIICQNPPQSSGKHPLQIRFKKISSLPYPSDIKDTCVAFRFYFSNREILDNRGLWIVSGFSEPADQGLSMRNIWMVDFYRHLRTVSSNCMACVVCIKLAHKHRICKTE